MQLIVEGAPAEELDELYTFFEEVGLPTTFDDLGIPDATEADIRKVAETSMHSYWDVEPFAVNPQMVFDGIMMANTLGKRRKACKRAAAGRKGSARMKAIQYTAPRQFAVVDLPKPEPGPHQVVIRVKACGICKTDLTSTTEAFWPSSPW